MTRWLLLAALLVTSCGPETVGDQESGEEKEERRPTPYDWVTLQDFEDVGLLKTHYGLKWGASLEEFEAPKNLTIPLQDNPLLSPWAEYLAPELDLPPSPPWHKGLREFHAYCSIDGSEILVLEFTSQELTRLFHQTRSHGRYVIQPAVKEKLNLKRGQRAPLHDLIRHRALDRDTYHVSPIDIFFPSIALHRLYGFHWGDRPPRVFSTEFAKIIQPLSKEDLKSELSAIGQQVPSSIEEVEDPVLVEPNAAEHDDRLYYWFKRNIRYRNTSDKSVVYLQIRFEADSLDQIVLMVPKRFSSASTNYPSTLRLISPEPKEPNKNVQLSWADHSYWNKDYDRRITAIAVVLVFSILVLLLKIWRNRSYDQYRVDQERRRQQSSDQDDDVIEGEVIDE